jgi:hypothetical protein
MWREAQIKIFPLLLKRNAGTVAACRCMSLHVAAVVAAMISSRNTLRRTVILSVERCTISCLLMHKDPQPSQEKEASKCRNVYGPSMCFLVTITARVAL